MTNETFYDITSMARRIEAFEKAMMNYRAVLEARDLIFKNIKKEHPNMTEDKVIARVLEQEEKFEIAVNVEWDDACINANTIGVKLPPFKGAKEEVMGILRKPLVDINKLRK